MITEAVEKIQNEIKKNKNPYVNVVGKFLIKHVQLNPGSADKILNKDKSIMKSLDEMKKAAMKKKVGNCAVLTDEEGLGIVLKYFEIEDSNIKKDVPVVKKDKKEIHEEAKSDIDFDVKLEDLL